MKNFILMVSVPVKGSFVVNKMAKTKEERIYVSVPVKGSFVVNNSPKKDYIMTMKFPSP